MMVEDVIRGELQYLPSSTPPSRPSWPMVSHSEEAEASVSPLRTISEVVSEDETTPAVDFRENIEELIDKTGVRSLKLRGAESRCCLGLVLGILVPFALASLVVLRSSEVPASSAQRADAIDFGAHTVQVPSTERTAKQSSSVTTSVVPMFSKVDDNINTHPAVITDTISKGR